MLKKSLFTESIMCESNKIYENMTIYTYGNIPAFVISQNTSGVIIRNINIKNIKGDIMEALDISNHLYEIADEVTENTLNVYIYQLDELNIKIEFLLLDKLIHESINVDIKQKCVWYDSLDEIALKLLKNEVIDEEDYENILMYVKFGIKP